MFTMTIVQLSMFDNISQELRGYVSLLIISEYTFCRDGSEKEVYKEQAMHSNADVTDQSLSSVNLWIYLILTFFGEVPTCRLVHFRAFLDLLYTNWFFLMSPVEQCRCEFNVRVVYALSYICFFTHKYYSDLRL
ncbi:hypothetical protein KC19_7G178100 [Ceratodon purpureus]|uniref:Uncharacterized protein n=1 Tax=Ceratodon purpureus TaxID=3225 RepID=A0A8T0HAT3_CERPU|nr:hypothetical protein KC19_7G178100 [Ceratodon purpureus]